MQAARKIAFAVLVTACAALAIYALLGVNAYLALRQSSTFPAQYPFCEKHTKYLNGGEKFFAGRKFRIVLCGDWGAENFMHDEVRMQIFSDSGELLAQRKFYVDWGGEIPLEYGEDYLIYFDLARHNDVRRKVSMSPTRLDWIRARLPLGD
jgi:hypothetical protein